MRETEKMLAKELQKAEMKIDILERKLKVAEDMNFKLFNDYQDLNYYCQMMEGIR